MRGPAPCGKYHDGPCLPLSADAAPDTRSQGLCDDCGRLVTAQGRGVMLQADPEWTTGQFVSAMMEAAAQALARGVCTTCGMAR